jgi:organic hydroperoxide reductase OsmC/OhrA
LSRDSDRDWKVANDKIAIAGHNPRPKIMSEHKATIEWKCLSGDFLKGKYSREHSWIFDGGLAIPASPSPSVVPAPYSNPAHVDPEEAFVASVASCHMLTFLYYAYRGGFQVESYRDEAAGLMTKNEKGILWLSSVTLRPQIVYGGDKTPTAEQENELHHLAHANCFIANSIKSEVTVDASKRTA